MEKGGINVEVQGREEAKKQEGENNEVRGEIQQDVGRIGVG